MGASRELGAFDRRRVFGSRQKLPAARGLDELDAVPALVVVMAQLLERGLQLLDRRVGLESGQRLEGRWHAARKQCCFKQLR